MDRFEILLTAEGFAVFDLESLRILAQFRSLRKAQVYIQVQERTQAA